MLKDLLKGLISLFLSFWLGKSSGQKEALSKELENEKKANNIRQKQLNIANSPDISPDDIIERMRNSDL